MLEQDFDDGMVLEQNGNVKRRQLVIIQRVDVRLSTFLIQNRLQRFGLVVFDALKQS